MPGPVLKHAEIISLATDDSSLKSGRELSLSAKWISVGSNEDALWGECLGSGKTPYIVSVDLREIAFKCTCPSRKFPCKHSLGLVLFHEREPSTFNLTISPPIWAKEWLEKRGTPKAKANVDASTVDRNIKKPDKRAINVSNGLSELKLWLCDLIRQGLADLPSKGYSYWDNIAARMVDAQAQGAARELRAMAAIPSSGPGWQQRLLRRIGLLHLLIEGFESRDNLPEHTISDIKTALGWTINQDELLYQDGLSDRWIVVGQRITEEDKLKSRRSWLYGETTGLSVLVLHFAYGSAPFDTLLSPGMIIDTEAVYYPSSVPQRAILKSYLNGGSVKKVLIDPLGINEAIREYSSAVSKHPWLPVFPIKLKSVIPNQHSGFNFVRDIENTVLPIDPSYNGYFRLLAESGSRPLDLFGEWDGYMFWPLSVISDGGIHPI